jgi:hypothetical protein
MQSSAGKPPTPTQMQNRIMFWKCANGIFSKKPCVEKYIKSFKPMAFFISECDIHLNHCLDLLRIKGYSLEVADTLHSKRKGRILVYVKDGSGLARCKKLEGSNNDIIVLGSKGIVIAGIYIRLKRMKWSRRTSRGF